jgi:septum formation protein
MTLVLASASPRRRELMAAAGLSCVIDPVDVDEDRHPGESPASYVERLAIWKAEAGARRHPEKFVIGADTTVVLGSTIYAKPADDEDAARMLRELAGRPHEVLTGLAVVGRARRMSRVEATTVWMAPLSEEQIAWYVGTGEPLDKAGGYAIQGLASRFIPRIAGSYPNVVGLPVATLVTLLEELGALPELFAAQRVDSDLPGPYPDWDRS